MSTENEQRALLFYIAEFVGAAIMSGLTWFTHCAITWFTLLGQPSRGSLSKR